MNRALTTVREHPRHLVLGAVVAGLLAATLGEVVVVVAAASLAALAGAPRLAVLAIAALGAGALFADARLEALDAGVLAGSTGRFVETRVVVLEPVRERPIGPSVARVRLLDGLGAGEQAVLRFAHATKPWPEVGDVVAIEGTVAPLGFADAYQRRRNAHAAIAATRVTPTGTRRGGLAGALDGVRRRAEHGLSQGLDPPEAALLRGMVLGEDERLSDDVRDDFKRSGLAHIVAVSGQNVVLLIVLVLAACALTGVPLRARLVLAAAVVIFYVPLAGGGPSIQRAGVMGVAGLIAALAGRPARRWYALLLAAAATLVLNPRAAGEPGWQLSFAAVAALLVGATPLKEAFARRLPAPLAEATAITVAATVGTAPLMALHFEQLSLAALPANLLAAPAIAPVMWLGVLAGLAGQLAPALALPFTALTAPLLVYVQAVAHVTASTPVSSVELHAGPAVIALAWFALLGATALAVRAWRRTRARGGGSVLAGLLGVSPHTAAAPLRAAPGSDGRPSTSSGAVSGSDRGRSTPSGAPPRGGVRSTLAALLGVAPGNPSPGGPARLAASRTARRARLAVAAAALVAAAGLVVALRGAAAAPLRPGELMVSFLDVGQGDATLIQLGATAVLVDTGPPDGPILKRLEQAHVKQLDALFLTHAEADHEGAAPAVIREYAPRLVVDGGAGWNSPVQRALPTVLAASRTRAVTPAAGQTIAVGGLRFAILWPAPGDRHEGNPNDHAIVTRLTHGHFSLLLTADAESNVTLPLNLAPVDVLKVAHHGSADAGLPLLLDRLKPRLAAIEVGRDNSYGHPTKSTLLALKQHVPAVVRTDEDGTVRLRVTRDRLAVQR